MPDGVLLLNGVPQALGVAQRSRPFPRPGRTDEKLNAIWIDDLSSADRLVHPVDSSRKATLSKRLGTNAQIGTCIGNSSRMSSMATQRGTKSLKDWPANVTQHAATALPHFLSASQSR
jgi:hypothetical protein